MNIKILLSLVAIGLAIISYIPYIYDIRRGKTKPHAFSWFIWAIIIYLAGFAQLVGGGGFGSLVSFVTATISLGIAVYSYRRGTVDITKGDWASLIVSLVAIGAWLLTKQPLASVVLVLAIDAIAFWPTIRKSYKRPRTESISTYVLSIVKHGLTIAAQQQLNLLTVLFPAWLVLMNVAFVAMLFVRRSQTPLRTRTAH